MKHKQIGMSILGATLLMFSSCAKDRETFDNHAYINNGTQVDNLLLKIGKDTDEGRIQTKLILPATEKVTVTYRVAPELLSFYQEAFSQEGLTLLPSENYELTNPKSEIPKSRVRGSEVVVNFKALSSLDREKTYLLPLTVAESNLPVLRSARNHYFVIRGAALVNYAANIANNNLVFAETGKSRSVLSNLSTLTAEALIRVDKFGKLISTIMGVEGEFLIRIGDAGLPDNQIQLATNKGNITDDRWKLETNTWTHVALTYDGSKGVVALYLNGVKKGGDKSISAGVGPVNWSRMETEGARGFWIGYSYDSGRFLDGDIVECRVWNRVLTEEEIQAKDHFYYVATDAPGLVAYWKFDDGQGDIVRDHTANANDLKAASTLKWKDVQLPTK